MTTPINNIPLPQLTSSANIETSIHPMANAIDSLVVSRFATVAARDAAITEPAFGQVAAVSEYEEIYYWNGLAWASLVPRVVNKFTTESFIGTTLQDDDDLFMLVEANSTYNVNLTLRIDAPNPGDVKFAFDFPSGSTVEAYWTHTADGTEPHDMTQYGGITLVSGSQPQNGFFGARSSANGNVFFVWLYVITSSTAGTLQFKWAQVTSAGASFMKRGSYMESWKRS